MKVIGLANVHVVMLILRIDFLLFETVKTCGRKNVMRYFALLLSSRHQLTLRDTLCTLSFSQLRCSGL